MRYILLLFPLVVLLNCNTPCDQYNQEIYPNETQSIPDSMELASRKKVCELFKEPDLQSLNYEAYRFIYFESFSDTIYMVRIGFKQVIPYLILKKLTRKQDHSLSQTEHFILGRDWGRLKLKISNCGYWMLPEKTDRIGADGSWYLVEGRRPDAESCGKRSYLYVSRWSPEPGAYRDMCIEFMNIAGVKFQ